MIPKMHPLLQPAITRAAGGYTPEAPALAQISITSPLANGTHYVAGEAITTWPTTLSSTSAASTPRCAMVAHGAACSRMRSHPKPTPGDPSP